jgi:hypothetical protein
MNSSHQRIAEVERYIHELAIALSSLPPEEREEVIAGIREHIDDALLAIPEPTGDDVRRILDGLGDPLTIAADAGARSMAAPAPDPTTPPRAAVSRPHADAPGAPTTPAAPASSPEQAVSLLQRDWIPAATVLAFAVAAVFSWVGGPGVWFIAAAVWLAGLVTLIASPLWSGFEKVVGIAVFGAGPVLVAVSGALLLGLRHLPGMPGRGVFEFGGWGFAGPFDRLFLAVIPLVVAVVTAVWLLHRGSARARG